MEDVHTALSGYLKGSYRFGMNEGIARYLLMHINDVPNMKLSEIADGCHVSTPSVIRFCRELGYEDFTQFKQAVILNSHIKQEHQKSMVRSFDVSDDAVYEDSVKQMIKELSRHAMSVLLALDRNRMEMLAKDIIEHEYVYMFGSDLSALFGEYLRIHLAMHGKSLLCRFYPNYDMTLTSERRKTLSIVVSQHNHFIDSDKRLLPYLRENSNKVWLITQEPPETSYRRQVDQTLYLKGSAKMDVEYHSMLCMADILAAYCKKILDGKQGR